MNGMDSNAMGSNAPDSNVTDSLVIHYADNVGVAITPLRAGERHQGVMLLANIPAGHKFALLDIAAGEQVIKYRAPIGHATADIAAGAWVHTHNCKTNLSGVLEYVYQPQSAKLPPYQPARSMFAGYPRPDGRVGIRNELWILPTVGCVNGTARRLVQRAAAELGYLVPDGIHCFEHPHGCSQLGEDHRTTRDLLAALAAHPNAGGVLVLGLGCENNGIAELRGAMGEVDEGRVKFLCTQDVEDEMEAGMALLSELAVRVPAQPRTMEPLSKLVVGLKCGGSDGFSGITANPLLGAVSDALIACGGSTVLTEVPEMFGAETLLMSRCRNVRVFAKTVELINGFKRYFQRYGQEIYENPSPGNKEGGITTLEEKSLGCTQKGGNGPVTDVLPYAGRVRKPGLNLMSGPGNDICAVTALAAAGCQLILFTTGRGTPLGSPAPVIKVASNSELARRKPGWIDFNAGPLVEGVPMASLLEELLDKMVRTAEGEPTRSEENGYRDIAIFKDGVTL